MNRARARLFEDFDRGMISPWDTAAVKPKPPG